MNELRSSLNKKKLDWPTVSVVIATRNSERTLEFCLSSVRKQVYPALLEIVIADGGSIDNTLNIARKYGAKIISVPENKQNAEYNKGVAVNAAKNDVLLMIDHDNILPHKNWLKKMVKPLLDDDQIFGSGVLRFHYDKNMSSVDRYSALFGGADPVPFFFNKSAHQSYLYDDFHLRGELISEEKDYYKVKLDAARLPALGGNGAILKRNILKRAKFSPDYFFHIDIHVDLAKHGFITYAFVKDTIIHLTNNNFIPFLRRRRYFIEKYHFVDRSKRRYSIYDPNRDRMILVSFVLYAATFIFPLIDATRGFVKIRDVAWFVHPVMCFGILLIYGITTIKEGAKNVFLARKKGSSNWS